MAESLKEIRQVLKANKKNIFKTYGVKELGIFGSYVRGEAKKRSDIDILVDFNSLPDVFLLIDLEEHLKGLLKKKVDLVRKGAIRPELSASIFSETVYV